MRGRKIRLSRYKWLFLIILLLHIVTLNFLASNDYFYFQLKQARNVHPDGAYSSVELPYANEVIQNLIEKKAELSEYNFFIEYYQNIPNNPLNAVYITWNTSADVFSFPIEKNVLGDTDRPTVHVGKNVYARLTDSKEELEINQKKFLIQDVLGEKGVRLGAFDRVVVIDSKDIDKEYAMFIPQNRYVTLHFLNNNENTVETLLQQLDLSIDARELEVTQGLFIETMASERTPSNLKMGLMAINGLGSLFLIVGIAVIIIGGYFVEQIQYDNIVKRALGVSDLHIIYSFIRNMTLMMGALFVAIVVIQQISIYFDLGILYKTRLISYLLLVVEQLCIQVLLLFMFLSKNMRKALTAVNER